MHEFYWINFSLLFSNLPSPRMPVAPLDRQKYLSFSTGSVAVSMALLIKPKADGKMR